MKKLIYVCRCVGKQKAAAVVRQSGFEKIIHVAVSAGPAFFCAVAYEQECGKQTSDDPCPLCSNTSCHPGNHRLDLSMCQIWLMTPFSHLDLASTSSCRLIGYAALHLKFKLILLSVYMLTCTSDTRILRIPAGLHICPLQPTVT